LSGIARVGGEFRRRLELESKQRRLVIALGRFGFAARELFLLYTALDSNSRDAKGFATAGTLADRRRREPNAGRFAIAEGGNSRSSYESE
jgi:hypothetical protein